MLPAARRAGAQRDSWKTSGRSCGPRPGPTGFADGGPGDIGKELAEHTTFESWGRERLELSKRVVYLNGDLKVGVSHGGRPANDADAPEVPADYPSACGKVARVQIGKAGVRLADQIKRLFR